MDERLNRLRVTLRMQWGQLADHIGLSRSMLDFVRKGQRNLSFEALHRLESAEREAGIAPPAEPVLNVDTAVAPPPPAPAGEGKEKKKHFAELCQRIARIEAELAALRKELEGH